MTSFLIKEMAEALHLQAIDPEERFMTSGVSWQQYEALLNRLGDSFWYRVTYLEDELEITAPSRKHELGKDNIGRLLSAYFEETRTRFYGLGSTTFRQEFKQRGAEPDASYCIGTNKEFPDLAIEVVETSGGIDKLEVYKGLGVLEVWFWQRQQFSVYRLRGEQYEAIATSELLPQLDLKLLAAYVEHPEPLDAVLEFREKVREQIQQGCINE
uniref:Uma2 family endonuclease n=1 Tax=Oscillatoriales cyanobacterium SpSt-402 TaxID=2282168 RepID=A0A832M2Q7_9CYAN